MLARPCLIVAAFALWGQEANAAAARVDFVHGEASVLGLDGRERPLARGSGLDNGDTVRTGQGRAQLRFSDGAYVSLQPHSEFAIRDYRFDGKTDGTERGLFGLAKGAMRTVTGLIGRVHRDRYRVTTPTATIGIRGTGGVIQVLDDGSTLIAGTSGIWSLSNPAGSLDVPAGVSALAPSVPGAPPQQTSQAPQAAPPPVPQPVRFTQGEERTDTGVPVALGNQAKAFKPLVSGSGYAAASSFIGEVLPQGFLISQASATATFDGGGQLTELGYSDGQTLKLDPAAGFHADFGTDGILAWGRWTGHVTGQFSCRTGPGCALNKQYSASQGLHYVVGVPTPVLPTSGTATYSLLGASQPTYVTGTPGPGTFSGSLNVTFGPVATIQGQFSAAMPDKTYAWSAIGTTQSSLFTLSPTSTSGCAISTCVVRTEGFFAGANAERAGISYHIQDANAALIGAAAFRKQ